jgi:hypothetical protein
MNGSGLSVPLLIFGPTILNMRKFFAFVLLALLPFWVTAQLLNPEQFLGYKVGTRYTPHWKVVQYVQHVASQMPNTVRIQQYGVTNEGRPLYVLFISAPEHISNLEQIRLNNLRLANLLNDKAAPIENTPVLVWLSYNVHGNETSSTEAAMLTLHALADPSNTQTKNWLKNTVVILDPCINPDGRDRYVNWFNSVVGSKPNARMDSREHREPWPGGRSNHYNFDLNRDWAWQTQVESKARIALYNQWMPQVHVDYHEQGINAPYYFAPAAEPYHEVITPWQREFQNIIGRNHARYFDQNGWLYFTKLRFDLFYPSYGDTYPTYNGAIGMTYEQGGIGAGLAAFNSDGDSLTLVDRVQHHFTTGLSTVETASANAARLISEFRKFFQKAVSTGYGEYKTYIIKNQPRDAQRIAALLELLQKNGIQYGTATATGKGWSYVNGREENFTVTTGDVVIPAIQPRSAMVQVLFEPRSKLSDSATYDITAWSIPYAYGLTAYASRDRITTTTLAVPEPEVAPRDAYAYIIRWQGTRSAKAIGLLLQQGLLLRYSEIPFEVNGRQFDRGDIIVLKTSNRKHEARLAQLVAQACKEAGVPFETVNTGMVDAGADFGSDLVNSIKYKRVVMLTGEGVNANAAGAIWHFFDQQLNYPLTLVLATDFSRLNWAETDVLILPDGNYRFLSDKAQADQLKEWINKGGKLIALEGAVAALAKAEWGIRLRKQEEGGDKKDPYEALRSYENRERDQISGTTPGSIYKVDMDNTHPLGYGYPPYYFTLKQDDQIYEFFTPGNGWNTGVIKKDAQRAGFVGYRLKERLKDGLLFGSQSMGRGSVVYLADDVLFRSFWENGKLMLCNAVFF